MCLEAYWHTGTCILQLVYNYNLVYYASPVVSYSHLVYFKVTECQPFLHVPDLIQLSQHVRVTYIYTYTQEGS